MDAEAAAAELFGTAPPTPPAPILSAEHIAILDALEPRAPDYYEKHETAVRGRWGAVQERSSRVHLEEMRKEAERLGTVEAARACRAEKKAAKAKADEAKREADRQADEEEAEAQAGGKPNATGFGYLFGGTPLVILGDRTLTGGAKSVAGAIAERLYNFPKSQHRRRCVSYPELAEVAGIAPRTAIRAVHELIDHGYLEIVTPGIGRRGNLYSFTEAVRPNS